jgi:hypothetical protein
MNFLSPNELIKYIIVNSSTAYKTRYAVLHHICFVIGNGMRWGNDGNLEFASPFKDDPFQDSDISTYSELKDFFGSNANHFKEKFDLKIKYLQAQLEFKKEYIDLISNNFFYFEDSQRPNYSKGRLSNIHINNIISDIPDNVNTSWLFVIKDFIHRVMEGILKEHGIKHESGVIEWHYHEAESLYNRLSDILKK